MNYLEKIWHHQISNAQDFIKTHEIKNGLKKVLIMIAYCFVPQKSFLDEYTS